MVGIASPRIQRRAKIFSQVYEQFEKIIRRRKTRGIEEEGSPPRVWEGLCPSRWGQKDLL